AERRVESEAAAELISVVVEVLGEAEGRDAEAVEHAIEGVQPALPRCAAPARRRTGPRSVPALAEEGARRERLPLRRLGIDVTQERFADGVEQCVGRGRRRLGQY